MRFDYFFYAGHATIGELYGVSIYYLTELVGFWEANIYEVQNVFPMGVTILLLNGGLNHVICLFLFLFGTCSLFSVGSSFLLRLNNSLFL